MAIQSGGVEFGYRWVAREAAPETGLSIPEALSLVLVSRHLKQALPATLSGALDKLFPESVFAQPGFHPNALM